MSDEVHDNWVEPLARACEGAPILLLAEMLRNSQDEFVREGEEPSIVPVEMKVIYNEEMQSTIHSSKLSNIGRAEVRCDVEEDREGERSKACR
jgi:hypothetical protein